MAEEKGFCGYEGEHSQRKRHLEGSIVNTTSQSEQNHVRGGRRREERGREENQEQCARGPKGPE